MKTLVLAAGRGSRLGRPLPKPLTRLGKRSILEHTLSWLAGSGVGDVAINLYHQPDVIVDHLGDGSRFGLSIRYLREKELLGTAGAYRNFKPAQRCLVVYGDNLVRFDLESFKAAHRPPVTIAVFDQESCPNTGIAGGRVRTDEDGRVVAFEEGGTEGYVNAGVYLIDSAVLKHIPKDVPYDFARELFPKLLKAGVPLHAWKIEEGFCLGIDTPETLETANRLMKSGKVRL